MLPGTGSAYLPTLIENMIGRMDSSEEVALAAYLESLGQVWLGTMCSGTESPVLVRRCIVDVMQGRHANLVIPQIYHAFGAEIDAAKRAFAERMLDHPPEIVFPDCTCLGDTKAYDTCSRRMVQVPDVSEVVDGFSCKDVSSRNTKAHIFSNGINSRFIFPIRSSTTQSCYFSSITFIIKYKQFVLFSLQNYGCVCTMFEMRDVKGIVYVQTKLEQSHSLHIQTPKHAFSI